MAGKYDGLSLPTVKGLRDLDKQMGQDDAAPAPNNSWAVGTPLTPQQTMRHPRTGEPLTAEQAAALAKALRQRQLPQAK